MEHRKRSNIAHNILKQVH